MNALGLDVTGVGNHEFDEGVNELLRMQFGGCHPVDGCQDGDGFAGAVFKYLAANVFYAGTDETIFPPYRVMKIDNAKIAFIGLTLEGTPTIVTPSAVAGLEFRPEVATVNALVEKLRNEQKASRRSSSSSTRAACSRRLRRCSRGRQNQPDALRDVNRCANFSGAEIQVDRERPDDPRSKSWSARTRISRTSARSTTSSSRARLLRPRDHGHRPHASTTAEADDEAKARTTS